MVAYLFVIGCAYNPALCLALCYNMWLDKGELQHLRQLIAFCGLHGHSVMCDRLLTLCNMPQSGIHPALASTYNKDPFPMYVLQYVLRMFLQMMSLHTVWDVVWCGAS